MEDGQLASGCGICNISETKALVFCFDCQEALCETCHASHELFKAMKHHNIFKLEYVSVSKHGLESSECWCRKHMTMKRFYCKTCDDAICGECILERSPCFDHQYVTLKEISREYSGQLKSLLHQCKVTKSRCQLAIKKTDEVLKEFTDAVETSKDCLSNIKNEYISMLDDIFTQLRESLKHMKGQRLQVLGQSSKTLRSEYDAIHGVIQFGSSIIKKTKFDIASNFVVLSSKLREICGSRYIPAISTLQVMNIELPFLSFHTKLSWKPCWNINVGSRNNSGQILDIVAHSDRDICVIYERGILILSVTGGPKHSIRIPSNEGVIALQEGGFILRRNSLMIYYHKNGKQISKMALLDSYRMPISLHNPIMITDSKGRILVGSRAAIFSTRKPRISVHNPDGTIISAFSTSASPRSLAATNNENVVISLDNNTVQLVKYSGDNVRMISKPPGVQHWVPREVCCGAEELFVVNGRQGVEIFSYTISGIYLGQVDIGLDVCKRVGFALDGKKILVWGEDKGIVQVFEKEHSSK